MDTSCGLIFTDGERILLGHTTNELFWDIPRGIKEENEDTLSACVREVFERTGLDLSAKKEKFIDLGEFQYTPYKKLHLYKYITKDFPDINSLKCTSFFIGDDNAEYPEVDGFNYFDYKDIKYKTNNKMKMVLMKILELETLTEYKGKIKKVICYVLRHDENDDEYFKKTGWMNIINLYNRCIKLNPSYEIFSVDDFKTVINEDNEYRFSWEGDFVRANYGHSFELEVFKEKEYVVPPDYLYHVTFDCFLEGIKREGLLPKRKIYVFLATDIEKTSQYKIRKNKPAFIKEFGIANPILLKIDAKLAHEEGIKFFKETSTILCCEYLPYKYITIMDNIMDNRIQMTEIEFD